MQLSRFPNPRQVVHGTCCRWYLSLDTYLGRYSFAYKPTKPFRLRLVALNLFSGLFRLACLTSESEGPGILHRAMLESHTVLVSKDLDGLEGGKSLKQY